MKKAGGIPDETRRSGRRIGPGLRLLGGLLLLLPALSALAAGDSLSQQELAVAARINRALPAVVGILTDVRADVQLRCGTGAVHTVHPDPERESGTGFLIHPDGWIATNGHVVLPIQKPDAEYAAEFLKQAATTACGPRLQKLPAPQRAARLQAILADPANRQGVTVTKRLEVYLPTGEATEYYPGVIKAFSPPIDPDQLPKGRHRPDPPMLDAALVKIEGENLPTVPLVASSRTSTALGQQLFITGYPGVVLWHPFLSRKSQVDPTVTFGRVSAFRLDVNERRILQTDAAISWGNSGGPAFNLRGEVLGLATFISTTLEGDETIQGFNFLIPIDTIHTFAKQAGITPSTDSPFNRAWEQALAAGLAGQYEEALTHAQAADQIVPGLSDVRRLSAWLRERIGARP